MSRSQEEFRLSCVVAAYLERCVPQLTVSHFPAGEARSEETGARLKRMGLKRGWPDYIAVLAPTGRTVGTPQVPRALGPPVPAPSVVRGVPSSRRADDHGLPVTPVPVVRITR